MFMHSGLKSVQDQIEKLIAVPVGCFALGKQLERLHMHVIDADEKVYRAHHRDGCQLGIRLPEFAGLYAFLDDPEEDGEFLFYQFVDRLDESRIAERIRLHHQVYQETFIDRVFGCIGQLDVEIFFDFFLTRDFPLQQFGEVFISGYNPCFIQLKEDLILAFKVFVYGSFADSCRVCDIDDLGVRSSPLFRKRSYAVSKMISRFVFFPLAIYASSCAS